MLGVCYYPEHWPEAWWADDARRMRELGLAFVRIGEFAWHCESRKVEKSCRPMSARAAACIASASRRGFTRQAEPRSKVRGGRRLTTR